MRGDRCRTCGHVHACKGTRCPACQRYWSRHGTERPAWMWGHTRRAAAPTAVDLTTVPDDASPRVQLARRMVHAALLQGVL